MNRPKPTRVPRHLPSWSPAVKFQRRVRVSRARASEWTSHSTLTIERIYVYGPKRRLSARQSNRSSALKRSSVVTVLIIALALTGDAVRIKSESESRRRSLATRTHFNFQRSTVDTAPHTPPLPPLHSLHAKPSSAMLQGSITNKPIPL